MFKIFNLIGYNNVSFLIPLLFFGSMTMFFATLGTSYSHVFEALLFTLIVYFFLKDNIHLLGLFLLLLSLTRYPAMVFFIPFTLYYFYYKKFLITNSKSQSKSSTHP